MSKSAFSFVKFTILFQFFVAIYLFFFTTSVYAGNPSTPTIAFVTHVNRIKIFTILITGLIVTLLNIYTHTKLFQKNSVKTSKLKLIFFSLFLTFLSNGISFIPYLLAIPDATNLGMFNGYSVISGLFTNTIKHDISMLPRTVLIILLPPLIFFSLISLLFSYILSSLMFKVFLHHTNQIKHLSFKVALISTPAIGIILVLLISETISLIFPFLGNKY